MLSADGAACTCAKVPKEKKLESNKIQYVTKTVAS